MDSQLGFDPGGSSPQTPEQGVVSDPREDMMKKFMFMQRMFGGGGGMGNLGQGAQGGGLGGGLMQGFGQGAGQALNLSMLKQMMPGMGV